MSNITEYKQLLQDKFDLSKIESEVIFKMLYPNDNSSKLLSIDMFTKSFIDTLLSQQMNIEKTKIVNNEVLYASELTNSSKTFNKCFSKILYSCEFSQCPHVLAINEEVLYVSISSITHEILKDISKKFEDPTLYKCLEEIVKYLDVNFIAEIAKKYNVKSVIFCGHGVEGVISILASHQYNLKGLESKSITFGSPFGIRSENDDSKNVNYTFDTDFYVGYLLSILDKVLTIDYFNDYVDIAHFNNIMNSCITNLPNFYKIGKYFLISNHKANIEELKYYSDVISFYRTKTSEKLNRSLYFDYFNKISNFNDNPTEIIEVRNFKIDSVRCFNIANSDKIHIIITGSYLCHINKIIVNGSSHLDFNSDYDMIRLAQKSDKTEFKLVCVSNYFSQIVTVNSELKEEFSSELSIYDVFYINQAIKLYSNDKGYNKDKLKFTTNSLMSAINTKGRNEAYLYLNKVFNLCWYDYVDSNSEIIFNSDLELREFFKSCPKVNIINTKYIKQLPYCIGYYDKKYDERDMKILNDRFRNVNSSKKCFEENLIINSTENSGYLDIDVYSNVDNKSVTSSVFIEDLSSFLSSMIERSYILRINSNKIERICIKSYLFVKKCVSFSNYGNNGSYIEIKIKNLDELIRFCLDCIDINVNNIASFQGMIKIFTDNKNNILSKFQEIYEKHNIDELKCLFDSLDYVYKLYLSFDDYIGVIGQCNAGKTSYCVKNSQSYVNKTSNICPNVIGNFIEFPSDENLWDTLFKFCKHIVIVTSTTDIEKSYTRGDLSKYILKCLKYNKTFDIVINKLDDIEREMQKRKCDINHIKLYKENKLKVVPKILTDNIFNISNNINFTEKYNKVYISELIRNSIKFCCSV